QRAAEQQPQRARGGAGRDGAGAGHPSEIVRTGEVLERRPAWRTSRPGAFQRRRPGADGAGDHPFDRSAMTHVLVVDDDPVLADLVAFRLGRLGLQVSVEADGEAGLAAARQLRPDLVVLDWPMPR